MPAGGLVVVSYNIHGAARRDGPQAIRRASAVLHALDADLIALQEVQATSDQLDELADALGLVPFAGPTLMRRAGPYGNGVLSRLPVLERRSIDLSVRGCEPRGAIDLLLDAAGLRLRLIATHLGLRRRERRRQRQILLEHAASHAGPLVLLGDLNEWCPLDRRWPGLGAARAPRTFPSWLPLLALDRILVRPAEALAELAAVRSPLTARASDHLPLRAVLRLDRVV